MKSEAVVIKKEAGPVYPSGLKSGPFFKLIADEISRDGPSLVKKVKGVVQWNILDNNKKVAAQFAINLKDTPGAVSAIFVIICYT